MSNSRIMQAPSRAPISRNGKTQPLSFPSFAQPAHSRPSHSFLVAKELEGFRAASKTDGSLQGLRPQLAIVESSIRYEPMPYERSHLETCLITAKQEEAEWRMKNKKARKKRKNKRKRCIGLARDLESDKIERRVRPSIGRIALFAQVIVGALAVCFYFGSATFAAILDESFYTAILSGRPELISQHMTVLVPHAWSVAFESGGIFAVVYLTAIGLAVTYGMKMLADPDRPRKYIWLPLGIDGVLAGINVGRLFISDILLPTPGDILFAVSSWAVIVGITFALYQATAHALGVLIEELRSPYYMAKAQLRLLQGELQELEELIEQAMLEINQRVFEQERIGKRLDGTAIPFEVTIAAVQSFASGFMNWVTGAFPPEEAAQQCARIEQEANVFLDAVSSKYGSIDSERGAS